MLTEAALAIVSPGVVLVVFCCMAAKSANTSHFKSSVSAHGLAITVAILLVMSLLLVAALK